MKGFTLRHFSEIESAWLEELQTFLMNLKVDFRPLEEHEIYEELITPPVLTVFAPLATLKGFTDDQFLLFKYGLLGLMEQAFTTKEFGFFKSEDEFSPAMPLGFMLENSKGDLLKLYFRNTKINPRELEEGFDSLLPFLNSNTWEEINPEDILGSIAFFDQHNWQFLN